MPIFCVQVSFWDLVLNQWSIRQEMFQKHLCLPMVQNAGLSSL